MTIEVKLLNEHEDVPARTLRIKHARGSLETPAYAVNVAEIDRRLIREDDLQGIVEVLVSFKSEQLENMNRDASLQQQFEYRMNSYMRRIPSDQLVVAIPILESKQGLTLSDSKAAVYGIYIAELISNPSIDIICTPVFHRVAEPLIKILVEEFLHAMTTYNINVALSIPYASRETWEKLIEIYFKWLNKNNRMLLNFLCVDYNGSNPISKYTLHNYVLRYTQTLQEEINESIVVYGVNVKYSRVAKKYDELPARDLAAYFAQLDVFGENHKRKAIPKEVAERIKTKEPLSKQKLLNRERYTYISLDKMLENPTLAIPEVKLVKTLVEEGRHTKYIERIAKRVNIRNTLSEAKILKQVFNGKGWQTFEKPIQYLMSKEIVRIDNILLQRLESFAKSRRPRTKKLDEYLK